MAQHDYNIANQSGAAFRQDLNNALAAIVSQNSGAAEPSTTYAYQFWADTTAGLLKIRNAANSAWITLRELDGTLTIEDGTDAAPGLAFADDLNTGIYSPDADQLAISTGGTERARINSSGRLLVGTSSADTVTHTSPDGTFDVTPTLEIASTGATTAFIYSTRVGADDAGPQLAFARASDTGGLIPGGAGTVLGAIQFFGGDGVDLRSCGGRISCEVDGTPGANDMPGRLVFSTTADGASSPTERMRIANSGIHTFTSASSNAGPHFTFIDNNPVNTGSRIAVRIESGTFSTSDTTSLYCDFVRGDGTQRGRIRSNGATAVAYETTSDYRLKENVVTLSNGINRLQQLKPYRFNFIDDGPDRVVDGFIAHEVQEVVHEAVGGTKDQVDDDGNPVYQGIDQSKLVPLLTAALQEAIARIETLEAKVEALENPAP